MPDSRRIYVWATYRNMNGPLQALHGKILSAAFVVLPQKHGRDVTGQWQEATGPVVSHRVCFLFRVPKCSYACVLIFSDSFLLPYVNLKRKFNQSLHNLNDMFVEESMQNAMYRFEIRVHGFVTPQLPGKFWKQIH